jgi:hypothetical protein
VKKDNNIEKDVNESVRRDQEGAMKIEMDENSEA